MRHQATLRRDPSGNWVISFFGGQKPCTRIFKTISHSFLHFSRAIHVIYLFNRFHHDCNAKKDQEKKYILTRHKNEGRRCGTHNRSRLQIKCALTENTQYTNTNFWILFIFSYFHATRAIQPRKKNWKPGSFEDYASKGCGISLPLIMT